MYLIAWFSLQNTYGQPDETVATETLSNHLRCNRSFVQDIFQVMYGGFQGALNWSPLMPRDASLSDSYAVVYAP